ncbi:MAG: FtsX-like permease family protein [Acidimicrobiales bacterium]
MKQLLRVDLYRFRVTFRRRWGSYVGLVVLLALLGGTSLGAIAAGRRTASSFPVYLASTNPSATMIFSGFDDPALGQKTGYNPSINAAIARLPLVTAAAVQVGYDGNIDLSSLRGVHLHMTGGETPPAVVGGTESVTMDRFTLVEGRMFDPRSTDEGVMNAQAARELGVHVGSVIGLPIYTDAEATSNTYNGPPYRVVKVKLVGEVVFPQDVVADDISRLGSASIQLSTALNAELEGCCAYYSGVAVQLHGGTASTARFQREVQAVDPLASGGPGGGPTADTVSAQARRAIEPEAVALELFGAIAGLAALLIAGLAVGRQLRSGSTEMSVLRALGATRAMTLGDGLVGVLGSIIVGGLLAVGVAVALSPLSPLGPVRHVYPAPGVNADWTVLGLGFAAIVVVVGASALWTGTRELRRLTSRGRARSQRHGPGVERLASLTALPISVATGLRFAVESGRGRNAAPMRSAILGTVIAVTVLVTTVTFGASLDSLVSHPRLYGWNWNYAMLSGFAGQEDLPAPAVAAAFNHDPTVAAWSGANFVGAEVDNVHVEAMTERPGSRVQPPLLSGHGLEAANQIVLGATTLAKVHKHVGDTVTLLNKRGSRLKLVIVGTATMTPIFQGLEMGDGALVATSDFPVSLTNQQENAVAGPQMVLARVRPGVSTATLRASIIADATSVGSYKKSPQSVGGVVFVLRPAEIVNYRSMGTAPAVLGGGLAVGAVIALGLTLTSSVRRRRRDLALLKTLGFVGRQLSSAVAWQSGAAVALGAIVGVPLGVVLGRALWDLFAREIHAVPAPVVPVLVISLIVVAAIALAVVVALIPGRMAATTPTALVLREE